MWGGGGPRFVQGRHDFLKLICSASEGRDYKIPRKRQGSRIYLGTNISRFPERGEFLKLIHAATRGEEPEMTREEARFSILPGGNNISRFPSKR
jgi:hypothetical protein